MSALEVLVVGAGAVGQVYGHHLARGGANVTFYVRERYRAEAARGAALTYLRSRKRRQVHAPRPTAVVCSAEEVAARRFDQVYLAIPSTGLARPWLDALVSAVGDAVLVCLTPSPGDRELLLAAGAAPQRLVSGLISIVAYQAPLVGQPDDGPEGTTVWYPPGSPCLFSGPAEARDAVIAALRAGKLPAGAHADVPAKGAFLSSTFMAILLALESCGWSLRELARPASLEAACAGARQAIAITAQSFGRAPLGVRLAVRPLPLRIVLRVAPHVVPFPLEPYLRIHFTKVGAQTRHIVRRTIERGRAAGLQVSALEALLAKVPAS